MEKPETIRSKPWTRQPAGLEPLSPRSFSDPLSNSVGKLLLLPNNTPHQNQESTAQKKQQ
ncbi:MAG: hypothetical protein AUI50_04720 [Crenarchaeota archaeon 13_1_40CM_2_52_14]|nr:MAG: hypothetical protein AUI97_08890 [Crenarchaeota archaeon 13_1_40CM_3_52_17]OLD34819.1 MAG: hypothetical protein AUI50_04720 [Crenarchaeota archaeon 13_1_40CM_2_52_14]OLE70071.1 MAG: hypothetical protein AUF78_08290 [archaeon 13_1_20CM_2_51_12]